MTEKSKSPIYYGWWVLIACAGIQFIFSVTFMNGFTVFFNPIVEEFKWSYTVVSLAATFRGFELGFLSPLIGFMVDRFGARKLLLTASILGVLGFFLFSNMNSVGAYFTAFIILGISISLSSTVVVVPAVIGWFTKRPSLAMGVLLTGSAISGLLVPAIVWSVDNLGWRSTLVYFAIAAMVICIPLSFLVRDPPAVNQTGTPTIANPPKSLSASETARAVVREKNFWLLSLAIAFSGFAPAAISAHQIPYLVSIGLSRDVAGWMVVVFLTSGLIGRLGLGWMGDVMDKRYVFILAVLFQAAGLGLYAYSDSMAAIIPSLISMGMGVGGIMTIRNALQLDLFGRQGFAVVQGLLIVFVTIGMMLAPPLAGWIFDAFHNYKPAWIGLSVISLLAVPVLLITSAPRREAMKAGS